jgi:hypothetical protein
MSKTLHISALVFAMAVILAFTLLTRTNDRSVLAYDSAGTIGVLQQ